MSWFWLAYGEGTCEKDSRLNLHSDRAGGSNNSKTSCSGDNPSLVLVAPEGKEGKVLRSVDKLCRFSPHSCALFASSFQCAA